MPIRTRGDLPDPRITAVRDRFTRPSSNTIDTDVYIEISIGAPDCQIYFTTDGSKPAPFKRWIGGREVTFRYVAPFALKSGKRVVRAVAVSRDGLLESRVVSKTFMVYGDYYDTMDSEDYLDEDWSDSCWESDATDRHSRRTWAPCTSWTRGRRSRSQPRPASADQGWIASTRRYPYNVETVGNQHTEQSPPVQIPDGPFNPINYSGTQINVWGAPPGSVWPTAPGMVTYGNMVPATRPPVQRGLLTREMIEKSEATDSSSTDDSRPLTVAEARRIIAESEAAESSASEKPEKTKKKSSGLRSGNVSFSGLARSGKGLLSSYHSKKKKEKNGN